MKLNDMKIKPNDGLIMCIIHICNSETNQYHNLSCKKLFCSVCSLLLKKTNKCMCTTVKHTHCFYHLCQTFNKGYTINTVQCKTKCSSVQIILSL